MTCFTVQNLPEIKRQRMLDAVQKLRARLASGAVSVVIGRQGGIAFKGWNASEREDVTDVCAYRALAASNSPELRRAIMRAEAMSGNKLNERAIASGLHSHDGGKTFSAH